MVFFLKKKRCPVSLGMLFSETLLTNKPITYFLFVTNFKVLWFFWCFKVPVKSTCGECCALLDVYSGVLVMGLSQSNCFSFFFFALARAVAGSLAVQKPRTLNRKGGQLIRRYGKQAYGLSR